jgi:prolyl oligopeptidase
MTRRLLGAATLALITPLALAAPPVAAVRDVPTTLHGTTVPDPYRWLEDPKSPEARAWYQGQGDAARSVLDRIEGRDAIAKRLAELADARGDDIRSVLCMPGQRFYYLKRAPGDRQFKLMLREGLDGPEKLLVDPQLEAQRTGQPHAVNYYRPSWDGKYVAYGMSAGGSEDASLYLLEVASGKLVGTPQPRAQEGLVHWLPDSRSFTFSQLTPRKPGAPETDHYKDAKAMWLKVGAARPVPVFGPTVTRNLGLNRLDVARLITVPGSRWVVARTTDTTVPEGKIFVAELARLGQPGIRWQRVATEADKVYKAQLSGDGLYLVTQAGAPRRKLVKVDLRKPSMASVETVVAEPQGAALEDFEITPGGVVAELRQGAQLLLRRYAPGDTVGRAIPAPASGAANLMAAPAGDSEVLYYSFSSWTEPSKVYRLEGERSTEVSFGRRVVPPGLPAVEVTDVTFPSHDGVLVPMTILHRKGLALDGKNPVLLNGYGSYGSTTSAYFSTETMAWIERGGVSAFVNPRGSGAYGDAWHRAGFKTTKPNTWKDGIAAAKYLIAKGYGSPQTMGIIGGSAGGIFVGRATTEAPELFAAAIYSVGSLDTVRAEHTANGATNISEFGTVADPAEFKALLEMSTYHAIKDGVRYPGVLLVHGMNDPRVEVWQSAKTAARLQAAQAGLPAERDPRPALLRLDAQAGHGIGSTVAQRQAMAADIQSFLLWQMGKAALKD